MPFVSMTDLGVKFGISAVAVGRILKDEGFRYSDGRPSEDAHEKNLCEANASADGHLFFKWDEEKITGLIEEHNEKILKEKPGAEAREEARQCRQKQRINEAKKIKVLADLADNRLNAKFREEKLREQLKQQKALRRAASSAEQVATRVRQIEQWKKDLHAANNILPADLQDDTTDLPNKNNDWKKWKEKIIPRTPIQHGEEFFERYDAECVKSKEHTRRSNKGKTKIQRVEEKKAKKRAIKSATREINNIFFSQTNNKVVPDYWALKKHMACEDEYEDEYTWTSILRKLAERITDSPAEEVEGVAQSMIYQAKQYFVDIFM